MDRNTILAFLLMGLIMILWPYYQRAFFPAPEKPQTAEQAASQTHEKPKDVALTGETGVQQEELSIRPTDSPQGPSLPVETGQPERIIRVETPLYDGTLTTYGGTLTAWELRSYETRLGGGVSIIKPEARGNLAVSLRMMSGDTINTQNRVFEIEGGEGEGEYQVPFQPDGRGYLTLRSALDEHRYIEKRYTFYRDRYDFDLKVVLAGIAPDVVDGKYFIYWNSSVPQSEANPADETKYVKAYALLGQEAEVLEADGQEMEELSLNGDIGWIGTRTKYFGVAVIPREHKGVGAQLSGYQNAAGDDRNIFMRLAVPLAGENLAEQNFTIYLGPLEYPVIHAFNVDLEKMMDFGWKFIRPLAKGIYHIFRLSHPYISNYGVLIILFSVLVKIVLHPLTKKSYMSMQSMRDLQPKMNDLREKYAKDPQKMNQAVMRLYKEEGVNPMGGCLPLLLQMPVFFAIYPVFYSTIEFRGAPFFGWITDLSRPDYVLSLPFSIPFYGEQVAILPLIMAASMFIQSYMNLNDPKQKMMVYLMPIMMLLFFNNISSGLVLYWSMFNLLALLEQQLIKVWYPAPATTA